MLNEYEILEDIFAYSLFRLREFYWLKDLFTILSLFVWVSARLGFGNANGKIFLRKAVGKKSFGQFSLT